MSSTFVSAEPEVAYLLDSKLALEMDIKGVHALVDFSISAESSRSQATRDAIMEAARAHFITHGFQGTRLANIARDAFVAPSTVSLHFKGKEALFGACLMQDVDRLHNLAQRAIEGNPVAHANGDFIRVVARLLPRFPVLATAMALSPHRWGRPFYENAHVGPVIARLQTEIEELQLAGIARPDLDPSSLARDLFRTRASALWTVIVTEGREFGSLDFMLDLTTDAILLPDARALLDSLAAPWRGHMARAGLRTAFNGHAATDPDFAPAA